MNSPLEALYLVFVLWLIVSWQRYWQARAARWMGDETPWEEGRESLNPMRHFDLFGTLIIPMIGVAMLGGMTFSLVPLFGWGKRLNYNVAYLRDGRRSESLLSWIGIGSLVVLVVPLFLLGRLFLDSESIFFPLLRQIGFICVFLAVLNLVPLPPLEGWPWLRNAMGWGEDFEWQYGHWLFLAFIVLLNFTPLIGVIHQLAILIYALLLPLLSVGG
jgi:Zn-dependent protease